MSRRNRHVCRALDGLPLQLPLPLELAAARVPVLGMHGLADHLLGDGTPTARLRLLTQGARTAAPHQRTLRAALDWSHALLTPREQQMFRRLGVFRGGFALAARAVAAEPGDDRWGCRPMACTRGSRSGEPAQSQAACYASIAQSVACLRVHTYSSPRSGDPFAIASGCQEAAVRR